MVLCIAQFSYGAPCRFNAKYGLFCGRHRPKEEKSVVYCKYISECGKQCKMSVSGVEHCFKHRLPLADNKQWKVYSPDVGWPYMWQVTQILRNGRKDCLKDLHTQYINFIEHKRNIPLIYSIDLVDTKLENLTTIIVTELFFQHFYLKFDTPFWQDIITTYVNKMIDVPFLKDYCELFRRKFDQGYRLEAQKKYIYKMLALNKLFGKDIARIIVSFL